MKKTNLHFKLAAWSIKNPFLFYGIGASVMVLCSVVIFFVLSGAKKSNQPIEVVRVEARNTVWKIVSETMYEDKKCLKQQHVANQTVVTSCYRLVNGQWVFDQSF